MKILPIYAFFCGFCGEIAQRSVAQNQKIVFFFSFSVANSRPKPTTTAAEIDSNGFYAIFGCFHPHLAESDEEVELEEQRPLGQTEEQQTNGVSTSREGTDAFTARMGAETTKKVYSSKLARLRKWLLQKHPDQVADGEISLPLPFDVLKEFLGVVAVKCGRNGEPLIPRQLNSTQCVIFSKALEATSLLVVQQLDWM
jgi:hypothetical protein